MYEEPTVLGLARNYRGALSLGTTRERTTFDEIGTAGLIIVDGVSIETLVVVDEDDVMDFVIIL